MIRRYCSKILEARISSSSIGTPRSFRPLSQSRYPAGNGMFAAVGSSEFLIPLRHRGPGSRSGGEAHPGGCRWFELPEDDREADLPRVCNRTTGVDVVATLNAESPALLEPVLETRAVVGEVCAALVRKGSRVARGDERNESPLVLRAYEVIGAVDGSQTDTTSEAFRRPLPADFGTGCQALVQHGFASGTEADR